MIDILEEPSDPGAVEIILLPLDYSKLKYRTPVWANEARTSISLQVQWSVGAEWVGYTTASFDPEPAGAALFARVVTETGFENVGAYVALPLLSPEEIRARAPPITRRQLRLTLVRNGISLRSVSDAIDAMPEGLDRDEMRIEWDDGTTYERLNPRLLAIAGILGLSSEQVDAMWEEARIA